MDTINLKMDIRAFYKSASIEELTKAVKEWSNAIRDANLKLRELRDVLGEVLGELKVVHPKALIPLKNKKSNNRQ